MEIGGRCVQGVPYDPLTMPKLLRDAHQKIDRAVDKCYRPQPFANDAKRVKFLFELCEVGVVGLDLLRSVHVSLKVDP